VRRSLMLQAPLAVYSRAPAVGCSHAAAWQGASNAVLPAHSMLSMAAQPWRLLQAWCHILDGTCARVIHLQTAFKLHTSN
jgi:hypothetical protein